MTVRLTVRRAAWERHVAAIAASVDGLLPVVKGNGYGFGRAVLHPVAATLADRVCVGTVSELDHIPLGVTPIVLTPTLRPPADATPILTVGNAAHVDVLDGWGGRVVVKLRSSMRRYGVGPDELPDVLDRARTTVTPENEPDLCLVMPTTFGMGFMTHGVFTPYSGPGSFGHSGAGGSNAFAQPERQLAVGYVMNKMAANLAADARAQRITDAAASVADGL